MQTEVLLGLFLPFFGTALGSACVFFMKKSMDSRLRRALTGFAAGVMTAASVWSLLLPAIHRSEHLGIFSFLPALSGLLLGFGFLLLLDRFVPHLPLGNEQTEGPSSRWQRSSKMVMAVTLHNLPEGMAVGVAIAGFLQGESGISGASVIALAVGIALQNFPEGAIISMPLHGEGMKKKHAFGMGVMSGIVEPVGGVLTLLFAGLVTPALPVLLSFAAGAMLFVVAEELIPEMAEGDASNLGTIFFGAGFSLMMTLDVALG